MVHGNTSNPSIRDSESVTAYICACIYIYIYIGRATSGIGSTRFAPRLGTVFFLFFLSFFPAPPSPRPTLVCPIPVSLTNAYREYVGNFDAPRSHQVSSPRCCENPIEVGTRHEEYFENISMARRGARKTRKTLSPPPPISFVHLVDTLKIRSNGGERWKKRIDFEEERKDSR